MKLKIIDALKEHYCDASEKEKEQLLRILELVDTVLVNRDLDKLNDFLGFWEARKLMEILYLADKEMKKEKDSKQDD